MPIIGKKDGIYLNTCHGSRASVTAPISAEIIASMITGEAPPLMKRELVSLSPESTKTSKNLLYQRINTSLIEFITCSLKSSKGIPKNVVSFSIMKSIDISSFSDRIKRWSLESRDPYR